MTTNPRFIMIGGFLGAGKTTTIARLARHYQALGRRVAIVTNDQATDLVDTLLLRSQGFNVGEVAGSCFCCNFDELTRTVERLGAEGRPEVVLAEPVGSCTDLVATVVRPLQQIYQQPFDVAPYGVIVKPSHGAKILRRVTRGGFSPQAEYIFRKQIEEADLVLLNRVDELPPAEVDELERLLGEQFPERPVVRMSAKTGLGFEALCEFVEQAGAVGARAMDVDYDVYAAGEAELGWLNSQVSLRGAAPLDLDDFLLRLLRRLHRDFQALAAETAHLKAIGHGDSFFAVANLVSNDSAPVLSTPSRQRSRELEIVVNARVAIDPERLTEIVRNAVLEEARAIAATATINTLQSFRPGRPVPTHRIAT